MTALEILRNKAAQFQASEKGKAHAAEMEAKRKQTKLAVVVNPRIAPSDAQATLKQYGW